MTVRDGFAAFILTHGRPEFLTEHTIRSLEVAGYTGPWFLLLDDEDDLAGEYAARFGADRIRLFHKDDAATDMGDNGGDRAVVVYARNAVDAIAAEMGLIWTLILDDDYTGFRHRFADGALLRGCYTRRLDDVIEAYLDFLEDTGALTVAFAQGGDYMGGATGASAGFGRTRTKRKAMNSFFCRVGRPIGFVGRLNEDVTTYVVRGAVGELFFTTADFFLDQVATQQAPGGLTGAYQQYGTYAKSFYTVMFAPSAVQVTTLGRFFDRIHHRVIWRYAVPKIISESYRKAGVSGG